LVGNAIDLASHDPTSLASLLMTQRTNGEIGRHLARGS
jgi:hypothetical protein